jgi:hypothetical protein
MEFISTRAAKLLSCPGMYGRFPVKDIPETTKSNI